MRVAYLSETQTKFTPADPFFKPSLLDRDPNLRIPTRLACYSSDVPITFYSHAVATSNIVTFPTTAVGHTGHPFRRSGKFSEPTHARLAPERVIPLPNSTDYKEITEWRRRLIGHVSAVVASDLGRGCRTIVTTIWSGIDDDSDSIGAAQLSEKLKDSFDFQTTSLEMSALVVCYGICDDDYASRISLPDLTNLIRSNVTPKRLELISIALHSLPNDRDGYVSIDTIKRKYRGQSIENFLEDMAFIGSYSKAPADSVAPDSFFDYYVDVSNEVESETLFENIIRSHWFS
jgi:hypothetical protein